MTVSGLYVITSPCSGGTVELIRRVEAVIEGGAAVLQYRDKSDDTSKRLVEARAIAGLCRTAGVTFIVNDDIELAAHVAADGVHLGKDDAVIAHARERLRPGVLLGISCYDSLQRALSAQAAGADYVAFGSFYPSTTKPQAVQAPLALLREAKQRIRVPLVAIGGISDVNAPQLIAAGAGALAVISSVFLAPDPQLAASSIASLFRYPG